MTLATLRANLKTAITSNSIYSVVDFGAEIVTTPSIMILSSDPWLEPVTLGNNKAWRVRYILELVAAPNTNPGALTQLETMVSTVLPMIGQSWQIQSVSSPRIRQANSNDVYSVEVSITTIYNP
jgi:hypothetical protein